MRTALRAESFLFTVRGLRPVLRREYLRVLACQKWGRYFLPRAKNLPVLRPRARFDRLRALRYLRIAGTGRGTGFSGPNKERVKGRGGSTAGTATPAGMARAGRAERGLARAPT